MEVHKMKKKPTIVMDDLHIIVPRRVIFKI